MAMDDSWRQDFVDQIGAELINARQMVFPEDKASGCSYFMEVMPGLMVLIVDFVFHKPIEFTKVASSAEFCIAYYDLSDQISLHLVNDSRHKVGYQSKLGLGIVDASLSSTYIPPVGKRMYSFRLLISKKILKKYLQGSIAASMAGKVFDGKKNTIFFYGHIKSPTRIALNKLKERSYDEPSFELLLKGVALKAFGHLIERMSEQGPVVLRQLTEAAAAQVIKTQLFLMEQLLEVFPGIEYLADMAGMSISKYTVIFKKLFNGSPNQFFLNEKMLLAQTLLTSGNFRNINEVAYELGYGKPGHFAKTYKKILGQLPSEVFIAGSFK